MLWTKLQSWRQSAPLPAQHLQIYHASALIWCVLSYNSQMLKQAEACSLTIHPMLPPAQLRHSSMQLPPVQRPPVFAKTIRMLWRLVNRACVCVRQVDLHAAVPAPDHAAPACTASSALSIGLQLCQGC